MFLFLARYSNQYEKTVAPLNSNVSIIFKGTNGKGTATIKVYSERIEEAIVKANTEALKTKSRWDILSANPNEMSDFELEQYYERLFSALEYEITPSENLSNGDEVILRVIVDQDIIKDYPLTIENAEKKVVVKNLIEPRPIDVFAEVSVVLTQIPLNSAMGINHSGNLFLFTINYTIEEGTEGPYAVGDKVTVVAHYSEEKALEYGYIVEETTKVFTIS